MEGRAVNVKTIGLTLTQREAEWLRDRMQNSLCPEGKESQEDFDTRKLLFDTLNLSLLEDPPTAGRPLWNTK
jgi:hypothetical protein